MLPDMAMDDVSDCASINREYLRQHRRAKSLFDMESPDFQDLRFREFCSRGYLTRERNTSAFCVHILHVFKARASEKMGRMITQANIAMVTNLLALWNISTEQPVRKSMRKISTIGCGYISVTMSTGCEGPQKALIISPWNRKVHLNQKTLLKVNEVAVGKQMRWAETCAVSAFMPDPASVWNRSIYHFVSYPVRSCAAALISSETSIPFTLSALPQNAGIVLPLFWIIQKSVNGISQIVETVNLIRAHCRVPLWLALLASSPVERYGASSILPQGVC